MLTGSPGQDRERLRNGVSRQLSGSHLMNLYQSQTPWTTRHVTDIADGSVHTVQSILLSCPVPYSPIAVL